MSLFQQTKLQTILFSFLFHYISTLKQELGGIKAYEQTFAEEVCNQSQMPPDLV